MTISRSRHTRTGEHGFTLIEVMMAIVILTVGLLSLAQMMVLATNSNTLSGRLTSASALAKEQLERLKATPFYSDPFSLTRNPGARGRRGHRHHRWRLRALLRSRWATD